MKQQNIFKQIFTGFLILLLAVRVFLPAVVLAQEVPTDTPAPTPVTVDQTQVDNSATATNSTDSSANTGNNTINPTDTPTPTDTPSDTPTPTIDPNTTPTDTPTDSPTPTNDPSLTPDQSGITATNDATVTNGVDTTANTGGNSQTTTDPSAPTNTDTAPAPTQVNVQTGDAVSVVAGSNTINTTAINSDVTDQTINIFGDQTGDIDLSTLFQLVGNIITNDTNNDPTINIQITGVNNYAYLSNDAVSTANTGGNTVNGNTGTDVVVSTGNAESVVSLLNKVNLTVVNSSLHLVTINIFGHLTGNIILPNLALYQSTTCTSCGVSLNVNNQATVNNSVTSDANTGDNSVTASGSSSLSTGNAYSQTNVLNIVNENILGMIFENLFLTNFGNWNGTFLGWDGFAPTDSGSFALSGGEGISGSNPTNTYSSTTINNTAVVNNNIVSLANTGANTTTGGNTSMTTGSAYSAVSLINLINSNFFKTLGFFGFINIFGNWDGNIGGADKFVTPTPTPDNSSDAVTADAVQTKEDGAAYSITNTNNVGAYVMPGDTVTFFLKGQNIGTGKAYGTKIQLFLIHNGQTVGGTTFNVGDLGGGRGVKISTGLVLSKNAAPGNYIARAVISGTTGENDTPISATADSYFTIFGSDNTITSFNQPQTPQTPIIHKAVLGATTNHNPSSDQPLYYVLLGVILAYIAIRVLKAREQLILLFKPGANFKSRLNMLRLFLL